MSNQVKSPAQIIKEGWSPSPPRASYSPPKSPYSPPYQEPPPNAVYQSLHEREAACEEIVASAEAALEEKDAQLERIASKSKDMLVSREEEIEAMEAKLEECQKECADLQGVREEMMQAGLLLNQRDQTIKDLKQKLNMEDAEGDLDDARIATLQAENAELKAQLHEQEHDCHAKLEKAKEDQEIAVEEAIIAKEKSMLAERARIMEEKRLEAERAAAEDAADDADDAAKIKRLEEKIAHMEEEHPGKVETALNEQKEAMLKVRMGLLAEGEAKREELQARINELERELAAAKKPAGKGAPGKGAPGKGAPGKGAPPKPYEPPAPWEKHSSCLGAATPATVMTPEIPLGVIESQPIKDLKQAVEKAGSLEDCVAFSIHSSEGAHFYSNLCFDEEGKLREGQSGWDTFTKGTLEELVEARKQAAVAAVSSVLPGKGIRAFG